MGVAQEDAIEGGGRTGRLRKVLPCGDTGGAIVRGRYLGVFCANGAEAGLSSCRVPATGDEFEGKKSE